MAEIAFYYLTFGKLASVLPTLLEKTLQAEKRALVCSPISSIADLSTSLWLKSPVGWLPHGIAGEDDEDAALCPIWLSDKDETIPNGAGYLFYVDGTKPDQMQLKNAEVERIFILLRGDVADHLSNARQWWKEWKNEGLSLTYWQQDDQGVWTKKADDKD